MCGVFPLKTIPVLLIVVFTAGCQTYSPLKLDLDAHEQSIQQRDIAAASDYANELRQLNATDGKSNEPEFDPTDGISLKEAEAVALMFNPRLRAARLAARVPLVGAQQAGRWDDPELDFDLLRFARGGDEPWIAGFAVKFTIPLSGRLPLEEAVAYGQAVSAWREVLAKEWRTVVKLRAVWLDWSTTGQRIALIESHLIALDSTLELARKQRAFDRISVTDLRVLELDRINIQGKLASLKAELNLQMMSIKSILGLKSNAPVQLLPAVTFAAMASEAGAVQRLRKHNVDLAIGQATYESADRSLQLELRKQYPDLTIGPAYDNEEGESRFGVAFSVPLPIFNQNRRAIAEATASRLAAKAAYEAHYEELSGQLDRTIAKAEAAKIRQVFLEQQVAPLVDKQLEDLRKLASLGDLDVVVLLDALTRRFETKQDLLEAQADQSAAALDVNAMLRPMATPTSLQNPDTKE